MVPRKSLTQPVAQRVKRALSKLEMKTAPERPLENRCTHCRFSSAVYPGHLSSSRVERQSLMTGFVYQTLPDRHPGRARLSYSAPRAASEGKSALLMQLKAATHQPRPWAPAEHQLKFARWLQRESAVPPRAH